MENFHQMEEGEGGGSSLLKTVHNCTHNLGKFDLIEK